MNATDLEAALAARRLLPVLTVAGRRAGADLGRSLLTGGLPLAEVTLRVDGSLDALAAMAGLGDLVVGAGTVLTPEQVDTAVAAGAAFVVCPGLDPRIVERCRELDVAVMPGVATPTELMLARALGIGTVKLFPADLVGGPAAVAALAGPFPAMRFVPTGGVGPENLGAYLSRPSVLAVGGSWLAPPDLVAAGRWADIEGLVRDAVQQTNYSTEVCR